MKVVAYTALHYGIEYLEYAIRSVINEVDEYHVLYSPTGSHGHQASVTCPEKEKDLYRAAVRGANNKLYWHKGTWPYEGAQRETIHRVAPDADVIVVLDADEIWPSGLVTEIIEATKDSNIRKVRVPMIHYWRSFYRAILHDPAYPDRIIYPKNISGENTAGSKPISHMGYAQSAQIVGYKQQTHGHRGEWRRDDWFNTVFMANAQANCHPVGSEYWNPEAIDPWQYMPDFMKQHPYAALEVIP